MKNNWFFKEYRITMWFSISPSECIHTINEFNVFISYAYTHVHSNIVHSILEVEASQASTNR